MSAQRQPTYAGATRRTVIMLDELLTHGGNLDGECVESRVAPLEIVSLRGILGSVRIVDRHHQRRLTIDTPILILDALGHVVQRCDQRLVHVVHLAILRIHALDQRRDVRAVPLDVLAIDADARRELGDREVVPGDRVAVALSALAVGERLRRVRGEVIRDATLDPIDPRRDFVVEVDDGPEQVLERGRLGALLLELTDEVDVGRGRRGDGVGRVECRADERVGRVRRTRMVSVDLERI